MNIEDLAARAGFVGPDFSTTVAAICHRTALKNFANLLIGEFAYTARQCYTVGAISAHDVATHVEEHFKKLSKL